MLKRNHYNYVSPKLSVQWISEADLLTLSDMKEGVGEVGLYDLSEGL